jgi:uncharacterized membrane protein
VLTGAAGLLASWGITLDKFKLLENPAFVPGCSLNPVVSCGSVMKSAQASVGSSPGCSSSPCTGSTRCACGAARHGSRRS